ncbi:NAD(P)/FAD-dependent oxidoreductase [soil metagenome]
MDHYDVAVVGAGHNALVGACYLAKAGKKVVVLERAHVIGGAVCTEEMFGGYKVDIGSSIHVGLPLGGIVEELGLKQYGLEYIEVDPIAFSPILGTDNGITIWRDLDKTCASIAAINPRDAETYRAFMQKWAGVFRLIGPLLGGPPGKGQALLAMLKSGASQPGVVRQVMRDPDVARVLMMSSIRMLNEMFESEELKAALLWMGAQHGPHPDMPGSATMLAHYGALHAHGAYRAIGGSGMASVALGRALESMGGTILTNAAVTGIGRNGGSGPARFTVRTAEMSVSAKNVLLGCHVQTAMLHLLDEELVPPVLRRRVKALNVANASGMMVRAAVSELPQYGGQPVNEGGIGACHHGMQLLIPSMETLIRSMHLNKLGKTTEEPAIMQMSFSAIDPTLAPAGKHVLDIWTSYPPYHLDGEHWDDIAEREADRMWNMVCRYSPNMAGKLIDRYIQTPLELERRIGLVQADVTHLDMGMDQMMGRRPLPELSGYRSHIDGIFLTGASTHPGGAVSGSSGCNAARVMLKQMA